MKKKRIGLILSCITILALSAISQTNNYPVKKINGIQYYVYKVQPSEGLMAIERKFEVTIDEISKVNPEVKNGLKVGQEILIPVQEKHISNNTPTIQYKVEKKQTLFAISNKYNVSQEDLQKLNPDLKNGLREGMILNIPDSNKIKTQKEVEKKKNPSSTLTIHKVQSKETLLSICKLYNVDIKDVIKLNPGVETKLNVGYELIISAKPIQKSTAENTTKTTQEIKKVTVEQFTETRHIKIAFLLPFMIEQPKKDAVLERFQNFYAGALLAIKLAKEKGISFDIYAYDTDKTEDKVSELLNNSELKTVDLIIGPAFSNQVSLVANFAKENKINTLIPFTAKVSDIDSNPYLFQFNPGTDAELKYLTEQLNGKLKTMNLILGEIPDVSPMDDGKIREEAMKVELNRQKKSFKVVDLGSPGNLNWSSSLKKGVKNLIVVDTDKYPIFIPYLNNFTSAASEYDITLFEPYSWRTQIGKKIQSLFISPFIGNMNDQLTADYNSKFDQYFGKDVSNDSPRYDILGYDLTNYFVAYINRYGSKFASKMGTLNTIPALQSQPQFERASSNTGFINQRLYLGENVE
jgi:LysM repeat protein